MQPAGISGYHVSYAQVDYVLNSPVGQMTYLTAYLRTHPNKRTSKINTAWRVARRLVDELNELIQENHRGTLSAVAWDLPDLVIWAVERDHFAAILHNLNLIEAILACDPNRPN